ncbi:hypothetical protein F4561_006593 [Lipingzhangella halophila]|uniref:Uncharacterized protein n=1 Tax=Lipingzhangella halophila TaxID=1783352 RepID=A0A7W7W763_9ACTN|nr:hypothetical protein [Lipingzhangella halophila]MBB4935684.1 hypothetical protein [Lipingzhangella halophila]
MPVIDLQRRMRQLGEIRIGQVVPTSNGKTRPDKLATFRFTSPSRPTLERIASTYGGDVREWTPANGGPAEWEVITSSKHVPVIVPPQAVTQWYEFYRGSMCARRCDGQFEQKSDQPCMCDPEQRDCSLTTRLNVMLRDVPPVGLWLLTTHGYYAAVELPPVADLLSRGGGNIGGWLSLEERRIVGEDGTKRFMVPTLDIDASPAQLLSGQGAAAVSGTGATSAAVSTEQPAPAVDSGRQAPAIESAPQQPAGTDWLARLEATQQLQEIFDLHKECREAGEMTPYLDEQMRNRADDLRQASRGNGVSPPSGSRAPDIDGQPEQAPLSADEGDTGDDADALWMQIVAAAGSEWTTSRLEEAFAYHHEGALPATASTQQLREFLAGIKSGRVTPGDRVKSSADATGEQVPF